MIALLVCLVFATILLVDVRVILGLMGDRLASPFRQAWLGASLAFLPLGLLMTPARGWILALLGVSIVVQFASRTWWTLNWRRSAVLAPQKLVQTVNRVAAEWQTRPPSRVYLTDDRYGPATFGVIRPVLLLPADTLQQPPHELKAILAHELAHIRSLDSLKLGLVDVARFAMGLHPQIRQAARLFRVELELAADERASRWLGDARAYAVSLGTLALQKRSVVTSQWPPPPTPALAQSHSEILIRMRHLIAPEPDLWVALYRPLWRGPKSALAQASHLRLSSAQSYGLLLGLISGYFGVYDLLLALLA